MPDVRLLESVVLLIVLPLHAEDRPVAPPSQELVNVELREQLPAVRLDAPATARTPADPRDAHHRAPLAAPLAP